MSWNTFVVAKTEAGGEHVFGQSVSSKALDAYTKHLVALCINDLGPPLCSTKCFLQSSPKSLKNQRFHSEFDFSEAPRLRGAPRLRK